MGRSLDEELQEFCTLWKQTADKISTEELTPRAAQEVRDDFEYALRIFENTITPTVFHKNSDRGRLNALKVQVQIAITQGEAIYRERERPYRGKKLDTINSSLQAINSFLQAIAEVLQKIK